MDEVRVQSCQVYSHLHSKNPGLEHLTTTWAFSLVQNAGDGEAIKQIWNLTSSFYTQQIGLEMISMCVHERDMTFAPNQF